jgi:hypothetical protein
MKKILVFTAALLIASVSVFGNGHKEEPLPADFHYTLEDFNGTWQQVNGASVITFKDGEFEIVNMEEGFAGWGINSFEYIKFNQSVILRFDTHNDYEGRNSKGYLLNLNTSKIPTNRTIITKDFQRKAWEEFIVPISKRNNKFFNDYGFPNQNKVMPTPMFGLASAFELEGDNLKLLSGFSEKAVNSDIGAKMINTLFLGEFVRIN